MQQRQPAGPGKTVSALSLLATLSATSSWQPLCFLLPSLFSPVSFSPVCRPVFCPGKVILQVKAGHLEACGLAVARCVVSSLNPYPPQGLRPRGCRSGGVDGVQHRPAMFNIPSSRQRLPCMYCQKQLALPLMADYLVQVISFQFWARTQFVRGNKLCDIFFGHLIGSLCHHVCVCSCE